MSEPNNSEPVEPPVEPVEPVGGPVEPPVEPVEPPVDESVEPNSEPVEPPVDQVEELQARLKEYEDLKAKYEAETKRAEELQAQLDADTRNACIERLGAVGMPEFMYERIPTAELPEYTEQAEEWFHNSKVERATTKYKEFAPKNFLLDGHKSEATPHAIRSSMRGLEPPYPPSGPQPISGYGRNDYLDPYGNTPVHIITGRVPH